jgi:hypothetical protein
MTTGLLIVGFEAERRKDLRRPFQREFSGVQIDAAETTAEAEDLLNSTWDRDVQYAVVIVDVKLPKPGQELVDDSLSRLGTLIQPRSQDPPAYFIVTTKPNDPKIVERLQEIAWRLEVYKRSQHNSELAPRWCVFENGPERWDVKLFEAARPLIVAKWIKERIDELLPLFGGSSVVDPAGDTQRGRRAPGALQARAGRPAFDPTQRLASLVRDIEINWEYLDKDMQDTVKRYFVVRPGEPSGVEVGLL